jgi:hypothetical protein
MAIVMLCAADDPGAVRSEHWSKDTGRDIFLKTSHEGLVLRTCEINGRDDSDFYAVVWSDATEAPERVTYASTRGWTYPCSASVDATPEVLAKYAAYCAARDAAAAAVRAASVAATPTKGARVKIVAGRKIAKGTEATVFWYGPAREFGGAPRGGYRAHGRELSRWVDRLCPPADGVKSGYRVGLLLPDGGKVFTAATNVAVIEEAGA